MGRDAAAHPVRHSEIPDNQVMSVNLQGIMMTNSRAEGAHLWKGSTTLEAW